MTPRTTSPGSPATQPRAAAPLTAVFCGLFLSAFVLLCPAPAHAQIRKLVDDHGHIVFVNAEENTPVRKGSGTASNKNSALSAAARAGSSAPVEDGDQNRYRVLSRAEIDKYVEELAAKHHVDPELIRAVILAESGYNPSATSRKGAQGLMQLMPGTAQQLGVKDAYNPKLNLEAGVRYLRALIDKYDGDLDKALAAYNAGLSRAHAWLSWGNFREPAEFIETVPFTETRGYIQTVLRNADVYRRLYGPSSPVRAALAPQ